ncbi:uncharacterized protein SPSK_08572 [Sporothrix schenckii 1099-18]|uniref:Uncharacterized protein n=1 Tax=Sporothrix schenckii 1099-18 TaxID=1397361 RepID=A0A0F2MAY3_SPOSC|nr:uncharacterized protein SPSK_08572 [Sporothrix schenckii 1099-18]KJR85331.1 hypothetical protein SPSK_08572 [Sporothrix schenckii 1099-18]
MVTGKKKMTRKEEKEKGEKRRKEEDTTRNGDNEREAPRKHSPQTAAYWTVRSTRSRYMALTSCTSARSSSTSSLFSPSSSSVVSYRACRSPTCASSSVTRATAARPLSVSLISCSTSARASLRCLEMRASSSRAATFSLSSRRIAALIRSTSCTDGPAATVDTDTMSCINACCGDAERSMPSRGSSWSTVVCVVLLPAVVLAPPPPPPPPPPELEWTTDADPPPPGPVSVVGLNTSGRPPPLLLPLPSKLESGRLPGGWPEGLRSEKRSVGSSWLEGADALRSLFGRPWKPSSSELQVRDGLGSSGVSGRLLLPRSCGGTGDMGGRPWMLGRLSSQLPRSLASPRLSRSPWWCLSSFHAAAFCCTASSSSVLSWSRAASASSARFFRASICASYAPACSCALGSLNRASSRSSSLRLARRAASRAFLRISDSRCSASSRSFSRLDTRASSVVSMPCQLSLAIEYCDCSVSTCRISFACESPVAPDDASSARPRIASSLLSISCSSFCSSCSTVRVRSAALSAFSCHSLICALARSAASDFSSCAVATCSSSSLTRWRSFSRAASLIAIFVASACSLAVFNCCRRSAIVASLDTASDRRPSSSLCTWLSRLRPSSCARSSSAARRARARSVCSSPSVLVRAVLNSAISFSSSLILTRSFLRIARCFSSMTLRFLPSSMICAIFWSCSATFFSRLPGAASATAFLAASAASLARYCTLACSISVFSVWWWISSWCWRRCSSSSASSCLIRDSRTASRAAALAAVDWFAATVVSSADVDAASAAVVVSVVIGFGVDGAAALSFDS